MGAALTPEQMAKLDPEYEKKEKARIAELASRGLDKDGVPLRPDFNGITNPDGTLLDQYKLEGGKAVEMNQDGYNAVKQMALRDPSQASAWASQMGNKQKLEEQNALESSRKQGIGLQNQALSGMAMRGGMQGGAANRLAATNLRAQLMNQQNVARGGAMARMDIGLQDEKMRQQQLANLTNLDQFNANLGLQNRQYDTDVNKFNLGNSLKEVDRKSSFEMTKYQELMKDRATKITADAQRQAASQQGGK